MALNLCEEPAALPTSVPSDVDATRSLAAWTASDHPVGHTNTTVTSALAGSRAIFSSWSFGTGGPGGHARGRWRPELLSEDPRDPTWASSASSFVYRRVVLMERGLDEPPIDVRPRVPAEMSILAPNEVDAYLVDRPDLHPADVHARLRRGAQCFAVRCGGRIVHAGWATTGEARIDFLWCRLPLAPGEVYQFGSFTHPDFRGLNLAAARIAWMARQLRDAGQRRLIAVVVPRNVHAFRPLEKSGYRPVGWMAVVRFGGWRRIVYARRR